jgi:dienelactone hydrolase
MKQLRHTGSARSIFSVFGILAVASIWFLPPGASAQEVDHLPGTEPLTMQGDLSRQTVAGVNEYLLEKLEASPGERERHWNRDYSSREAYTASVDSNRQHLLEYTGAVDDRAPVEALELLATTNAPALVAETNRFTVYAVRWPVLEDVDAHGLWLEPKGEVRAQVVALPDADWTPEMVAGLASGVPPEAQYARKLAAAGMRVLVPTLIDRDNRWTGNPLVRKVDIPHRTFIYLQAFHMGRHIIGYEMLKVMAAVDYFERQNREFDVPVPIGVIGYGEGGLTALYTAAVDRRIDATVVSGYFDRREKMWREPVYRNVWSFLDEFGDAGAASLVAPRTLVIEASRGPGTFDTYQAKQRDEDMTAAARLATPDLRSVRQEFQAAAGYYRELGMPENIDLIVSGASGDGLPGSEQALSAFVNGLGLDGSLGELDGRSIRDRRKSFDSARRMKQQYEQLITHNQKLMRLSPLARSDFWAKTDSLLPIRRTAFHRNRTWSEDDTFSLDRWNEKTRFYRDYFWKEIVGRLPEITRPPRPRTRLIYETPRFRGYEVVTDGWQGVINYGIILVPKDLKPGEIRPVVVTQHGHAGRPQDVTNPEDTTGAYHAFGARLADRGFVVYAPQNLYTFNDIFGPMQRKAHPLKQTFFGAMVRQHEQVLEWLGSLAFVDEDRIGFYGLSYGGKSAMFIPAILDEYTVSICSGDFNQRVWKHVDVNSDYTFPYTGNNSQLEFGIGETFNYAEIAALIAPRPFMVERGHYDIVAPDEWVAYEYARVRWLYAELGIQNRTAIEFFKGPHEIHGEKAFSFLHEHLEWPER